MTTPVLAVTMVLASGLLAGAGGRYVLRRLPEPRMASHTADRDQIELDADRAEIDVKPTYRSLATLRFSMSTAVLSSAAATIAVSTQPGMYWPIWFVFGTVAVLLAAIDAVSTWLPNLIVYPGWLAMTVALVATWLNTASSQLPWAALIRIVGCAALAGGFYLLLWFATRGRGIAFGDVRLMPLVGAAAGSISWAGLYWSLLFGSLIGAVIGMIRIFVRRRGSFPYAPALVAGPYAAAVLLAVLA